MAGLNFLSFDDLLLLALAIKMGRGRPSKVTEVKPNETCLSLGLPLKVCCFQCLSDMPSCCERAWSKEEGSSEEIQAYIDAWCYLISFKGYGKPATFRNLKKLKRWTNYIKGYEELYKDFIPSSFASPSNDPTNTPSRAPSSKDTLASMLKSAIKTPLQRLKSFLKPRKSNSSLASTPEPVSPPTTSSTSPTPPNFASKKKRFPSKRLTYDPPPAKSPLLLQACSPPKEEGSPWSQSSFCSPFFEEGPGASSCGNQRSQESSFNKEIPTLLTVPPPPLPFTNFSLPIKQGTKLENMVQPPSVLCNNIYFGPTLTVPPPQLIIKPFSIKSKPKKKDSTLLSSTEDSSKFHLLDSLGIKTSIMDYMDIELLKSLISDVVALSQNQNIPLDFKYKGNNSPARLLAIAPCKDSKNFLKKQKKDGWLENALKFIASKSITSPDDVAEWIVNFVASNYEESFNTIASEYGYEKRRIMCPIETAAMITDANININQARTIVRHMRNSFGHSLISSIEKVRNVTNGWQEVLSPPIFWTYDFYDKKYPEKNAEKVHIWVSDAVESIAYDMKLVVDASIDEEGGKKSWGYELDDGTTGVNVIVGSDHGCGSSQLLAKLNYESSTVRRETGKIEGGSRVTQYGCIQCRKDKEPILLQVAPTLNKTLSNLEKGMLMGLQDKDRNIDVVYVPKDARESVRTSMTTNDKVLMKWWSFERGIEESVELKHLSSNAVELWPVIENFYYNISGDLSYFHTLQGRDGTSGSRCPYCDLRIQQWKKGMKGNLLTLKRLLECYDIFKKWEEDVVKAEAEGKRPPPNHPLQ